jgi:hypothetical protein
LAVEGIYQVHYATELSEDLVEPSEIEHIEGVVAHSHLYLSLVSV